jgi:transcriptional regulator GlxA family with amidase domain
MASQKTVGVLLFEGFELLDVFGPLEAWGMHAEIAGACTIVTAAEKGGAVKSAQGPRAIADYALAECPRIDVMLVPGGIGTRREVQTALLLDWLRQRAAQAEIVSSVCTGAALLARAGLLDGRRATSNKLSFKWVTEQGPAVEWIRPARWVEDGKFATSSGVSAGIDMTLALIARLASAERAEQIANAVHRPHRRRHGSFLHKDRGELNISRDLTPSASASTYRPLRPSARSRDRDGGTFALA